jgi:hypothetical protein
MPKDVWNLLFRLPLQSTRRLMTREICFSTRHALWESIDVVASPQLIAVKHAEAHTLQPVEPHVVWMVGMVSGRDSQIYVSR